MSELEDQDQAAERRAATGAGLLDEVVAKLLKFLVFSPEAAAACALYAAVTYASGELEVAPRLVIKSPVPRCGKSLLLDLMSLLCNRPEMAGNISPAALVRLIDPDDPPTFVMDENDVTFGRAKGTDEKADYLRQVLNLGHKRGYPYRRYNAVTSQVEDWPTFAMAMLAGIGDLPDTIEDRAVIIHMRRKARNEDVVRFRLRVNAGEVRDLGTRLKDWASKQAEAIAAAWPALPDELNDRQQDTWEPLLAVADLAGGDWPARARAAALRLCDSPVVDKGPSARLLADLRAVWEDAEEKLATTVILRRLFALDESPWRGSSKTAPLNPYTLAKMLEEFEIRPAQWRVPGVPPKDPRSRMRGYWRGPLADAWERYAPEEEDDSTEDDAQPEGGIRDNRDTVTPQVSELPLSGVTDAFVTRPSGKASDQACHTVTVVTDTPPRSDPADRAVRVAEYVRQHPGCTWGELLRGLDWAIQTVNNARDKAVEQGLALAKAIGATHARLKGMEKLAETSSDEKR